MCDSKLASGFRGAGGYSADSMLGLRLEVRAGETCVGSTLVTPSLCAPHSTLGNPVPLGRDMCLKVARIL